MATVVIIILAKKRNVGCQVMNLNILDCLIEFILQQMVISKNLESLTPIILMIHLDGLWMNKKNKDQGTCRYKF
jgi:hypothetical protein